MTRPAEARAIPINVLESCPYPCFVVNESLEINYCNQAWNKFAMLNEGGTGVLAWRVLSHNLLDFVPEDLRNYHTALFARARETGKPVTHDYECSSATMFRLFRMHIFPLGQGFAVINSLRVEHPHDRATAQPDEAKYRNRAGMIRMCSNCRRTNRVEDSAAWDWVPDYVERMRPNSTHGVCPTCMEYYYGEYLSP
jgi:predicted outer membrane lipoprotein